MAYKEKILKFFKNQSGKIISGVIIAFIVAAIITGITKYRKRTQIEDMYGKWNVAIDYDLFFSHPIQSFGKIRIRANGHVYIVEKDGNTCQGLAIIDIVGTPENLGSPEKIVSLVLEFSEITSLGDNKFETYASVKNRQTHNLGLQKFIVKRIPLDDLKVPSDYLCKWEFIDKKHCNGTFLGKLKQGTETTKGALLLSK